MEFKSEWPVPNFFPVESDGKYDVSGGVTFEDQTSSLLNYKDYLIFESKFPFKALQDIFE